MLRLAMKRYRCELNFIQRRLYSVFLLGFDFRPKVTFCAWFDNRIYPQDGVPVTMKPKLN